jgi:hypothetical protein
MSKHTFSKHDGGPIDRSKAQSWVKKYHDKHKDSVRAYFFGTDIIEKIIHQEGAVGMRVYLAYGDEKDAATKEDRLQMVLVGVKEDGTVLWPSEDGKDTPPRTAGDNGMPCPPYC